MPEIGALSAHLVHQPLVQVVLFRESGVGHLVAGVVLGDEVLDYGAGFPEDEAVVGVPDYLLDVNDT